VIPVVITICKSVFKMKIHVGCFVVIVLRIAQSITCEGGYNMSFCSHIPSLLCQNMEFSYLGFNFMCGTVQDMWFVMENFLNFLCFLTVVSQIFITCLVQD